MGQYSLTGGYETFWLLLPQPTRLLTFFPIVVYKGYFTVANQVLNKDASACYARCFCSAMAMRNACLSFEPTIAAQENQYTTARARSKRITFVQHEICLMIATTCDLVENKLLVIYIG